MVKVYIIMNCESMGICYIFIWWILDAILMFRFWSIMANEILITINLKWKDYRNVYSGGRMIYFKKSMGWLISSYITWANDRKMCRLGKDSSSLHWLPQTQRRRSAIYNSRISNYTFDMSRKCLIIKSKNCYSIRNISIRGVLRYKNWRDSKESIHWLLIIMLSLSRRR